MELEESVRGRKRTRNEHKYKANIIKKARLRGESYTSHSGQTKNKLKFGSDCR